jgi:hypothetical protein
MVRARVRGRSMVRARPKGKSQGHG